MGIVVEAFTLAIGFTLIRALGQGVFALWFVRKRGLAIGLTAPFLELTRADGRMR